MLSITSLTKHTKLTRSSTRRNPTILSFLTSSSSSSSSSSSISNTIGRPCETQKFSTSHSLSSSSSTTSDHAHLDQRILQTPLFKSATNLLNGLDTYTVKAEDGHPISLYGINSDTSNIDNNRRPVLMLHGRTWSSVPVYHLQGGGEHTKESRSLLESFYKAGLQPYAMDFRGFGGTPHDATRSIKPNRCVKDVEAALDFISRRHDNELPSLLGWSQGALVAQLIGQKPTQKISNLILYGSIYNPTVNYPRVPLFVNDENDDIQIIADNCTHTKQQKNSFNAAIEDFTVEGSIPPDVAVEFAEAALLTDPYKAKWKYLCQFNNCDPARVHFPTLVVAGDQDPYAPLRVQAELFTNLGRGNDRIWSVISDADHAVHLLDTGRKTFLKIVTSFIESSKKGT